MNKYIYKKFVPVTGLLFVTVITSQIGFAQDTDEEEIYELGAFTVQAERGTGYLAPVSFSTSRAAMNFMDVPLSVQVVTKDLIDDSGVFTLADAIKFVSGTSEGRLPQGGGISMALRGFEPTVTIDGFRPAFSEGRNNLTNTARVEVLKGPSAILFTNGGSPGGTVNIITKRPLDIAMTSISGTVGLFNGNLIEFDSTGPIADSPLSYRFVASYQNDDDYWVHYHTDAKFVAPSLSWKLSDWAKLTLKYEYNDRVDGKINGQPIDDSDPANPKLLSGVDQDWQTNDPNDRIISEDQFWSADLEFKLGPRISGFTGVQYGESEPQRIGSRPNGSPIVQPDGSIPRRAFHIAWDTSSLRWFTDFVGRFDVLKTHHTFITGAEYARVSIAQGSLDEPAGVVPDGQLNVPAEAFQRTISRSDIVLGPANTTTTTKAFVMDSMSLWQDRITLMGGLTWNYILNPSQQAKYATVGQYGILVRPIENISIYYSYNENFSPNYVQLGAVDSSGSPILDSNGNPVELGAAPAQNNEAKEFGVKALMFDGKLSVTAAYFETSLTNRTQLILGTSLYSLVGAGESSGFEVDIAGQLTDRISVIFSYANIDAVDSGGNRLENSPENIFNLWGKYEMPLGEKSKLSFGAGLDYVDDRDGISNWTYRFNIPGRTLLNALVKYTYNEHLSLQLNVQNLTDEYYYTAGFQPSRIATGRGRNVLLKATYTF